MSEKTNIQWTQHSWNPWRGCTKIHARCKNCYMFTEQSRYGNDPSVVMRTKTWGDPIRWQKSALARGAQELVFTCSWSDWFHADADQWRDEAWAVVRACPNLTFQILTKRPERIKAHLPADWGQGYPNVWLGSSLNPDDENGMALFEIPAKVLFLSLEPLLADVDLGLTMEGAIGPDEKSWAQPTRIGQLLSWVICGGESGPGARPCEVQWIRSVVQQCKAAGVSCFVKQMGSVVHEFTEYAFAHLSDGWRNPATTKAPGDCMVRLHLKDKKGGDMAEWPTDLRVRQFPTP